MAAKVKLVIVAGCQCAGRHCRPSISDRWLAPKPWFLIIYTHEEIDGRQHARQSETRIIIVESIEYCESLLFSWWRWNGILVVTPQGLSRFIIISYCPCVNNLLACPVVLSNPSRSPFLFHLVSLSSAESDVPSIESIEIAFRDIEFSHKTLGVGSCVSLPLRFPTTNGQLSCNRLHSRRSFVSWIQPVKTLTA
jgi:hypothetical protein